MPLAEQELLTFPEHLSSSPFFNGFRVAQYLVFCKCFIDHCWFFFVLLLLFTVLHVHGFITLILKYDVTKFLNAYDTICIMITWGMAIIHIYVPLVMIWFPDHDDDNCTVLVKWLIYWLISYTDNILLVVSFDQLLMNTLLYAHFYSYHWIALYKNPSGTYLCMLHKFLAIWQSLNISNNSSTLYNTWNLSLLSKTYRLHIL